MALISQLKVEEDEAEKKFDGSDYGAHVIKVTRHVFFDLFDLLSVTF